MPEADSHAEAVLAFRGLRLEPPGGPVVEIADLAIRRGRSLLAFHRSPVVLRTLAALAAGRDPAGVEGAAPVTGEALREGEEPGARRQRGSRLGLYRSVALVDDRARLLSGTTIIETLELELCYNQGLNGAASRRAAMEVLDKLGLGALADEPEEALAGPERGLAVMALALSRRPALLVLDRPRALMIDEGFRLAWAAAADSPAGPAILALDYGPDLWPKGLSADEVLALEPDPAPDPDPEPGAPPSTPH
jgi:predicted ABC-type transport system involved in lysophospholipase L1 biosynthesis ATPase subunit